MDSCKSSSIFRSTKWNLCLPRLHCALLKKTIACRRQGRARDQCSTAMTAFVSPAVFVQHGRSRRSAWKCSAIPVEGTEACVATRRWAHAVVVGLGLCPFAANALENDGARFVEYAETDERGAEACLWAEVAHLDESPATTTTLMVFPRFTENEFRRWHAFTRKMERKIERDERLAYQVLLACFHPEHTWGGESERSPVHFDRRAPYPTINILRAPQVDEAIEEGKTEGILERNQESLHKVGYDRLVEMFRELQAEDSPISRGRRDGVR